MVDIPNEFIQTRVQHKKYIAIIKIRGVLVDTLLENFPYIYEPYVTTYCKGVKQLIVQYQNAIYKTMIAIILYYQKFRKRLGLKDINSIHMTRPLKTRSSRISK